MKLNLMEIPLDERLLRKSGAQFKGRILKDKDNRVEIQVEREKGIVTLEAGQQCVLSVVNAGDKPALLTGVIVDLVTKVLGGHGADGRPTKQMSISEMRPYTRVIEAFRAAKDGAVEIDGDDLRYLHRKFSALNVVPHPDSAPVIVNVEKFLCQQVEKIGKELAENGKT